MNRPTLVVGFSAALMLGALSCAHETPVALTPEGANVRVSEGSELEDCEPLGDFASGPLTARGMPPLWSLNQVRNLAAERGATDVVVESQARGIVVGRAYRCR